MVYTAGRSGRLMTRRRSGTRTTRAIMFFVSVLSTFLAYVMRPLSAADVDSALPVQGGRGPDGVA